MDVSPARKERLVRLVTRYVSIHVELRDRHGASPTRFTRAARTGGTSRGSRCSGPGGGGSSQEKILRYTSIHVDNARRRQSRSGSCDRFERKRSPWNPWTRFASRRVDFTREQPITRQLDLPLGAFIRWRRRELLSEFIGRVVGLVSVEIDLGWGV